MSTRAFMPTLVRVRFDAFPRRFLALGSLCAFVTLAPAQGSAPTAPTPASPTTAPAVPPAPPQFLEPTAVDFLAIIPPPPPEDSPADRADLQTVLNIQADRTLAQAARADRVAKQTVFTFAGPVLGPWFTAENLPHTAEFFKIVTAESYAVATLAKRHFNRLRPMLKDSQVQATTGRMRSTSYPSGHSSDAATWAVLLAEIFPQHGEALMAQVRETMWGRVLAGAHYPSDTQAGQTLGIAIGHEMLKNSKLRAALLATRDECLPFANKIPSNVPAQTQVQP